MAPAMVFCSVTLLLSSLASPAQGSAFLPTTRSGRAEQQLQHVDKKDVEKILLLELSGLVNVAQLHVVEEELRPMFVALPKSEQGTLDFATVRYALHRFFTRRHGWYVQGLDPAGDAWGVSSPTSVLEELAPSYVQQVFAQRLQGQGLGLRELAAFAATLLDLVHAEAVSHFEDIFSTMRLPSEGPVSHTASALAVKAYLMEYVMGLSFNDTDTASEYEALEPEVVAAYPGWTETSMWAQDLFQDFNLAQQARENPFVGHTTNFDHLATFVKELGHHFGFFQNLECSALKNRLVDMDVHGTGRVPLAMFRSGGLNGDWHLTESREYLRHLGALDETDPQQPSVLIPNYVNSQSNCLMPSTLYSVCCLDECESLLDHLEREIAAPSATASRIADVVSHIASGTVDAPRNLSSALMFRLEEIGDLHDGRVLLHGRLFAQWMHHAYPRECPFPHVAGTTSRVSPFEWMAVTGLDSPDASEEELRMHLTMGQDWVGKEDYMTEEDKLAALPWIAAEEHLVGYRQTAHAGAARHWLPASLRRAAACLALAAATMPLLSGGAKLLPTAGSSILQSSKPDAYLV